MATTENVSKTKVKRTIDASETLKKIEAQVAKATTGRERLDRAEQRLAKQIIVIAKLVQQYNCQRLDPIIEQLIAKGLAVWPEGFRELVLVKESELGFVTDSGVREVWRGGEYYSRVENVAYCETEMRRGKGGSKARKGQTVREWWIKEFHKQFANLRWSDMPAWLLIALEPNTRVPEPISAVARDVSPKDSRYTYRFDKKADPYPYTQANFNLHINGRKAIGIAFCEPRDFGDLESRPH
jgi:hypothetical protein